MLWYFILERVFGVLHGFSSGLSQLSQGSADSNMRRTSADMRLYKA
jgi:hypothetical protein